MYSILVVDISPTFYCLPYLALTRVWFDVTIIDINTIYPLTVLYLVVVMLESDWGLRMVINITCFKIPGSGFIPAAFEYPSMTNKDIIQYLVY